MADGRRRGGRRQGMRVYRTSGRRRMLRVAGLARLSVLLVIAVSVLISILAFSGALANGSRSSRAGGSPSLSPSASGVAGPTASGEGSQPAASPAVSTSVSPSRSAPTAVDGSPFAPPPATIHPKDARQVQEALVRLHYLPPDAVTGTFDYRTSQAVMAFQSWQGLQRDGVVGKQTARSLEAAQPPLAAKQGSGRWVEIHRAQSTLLLVQDGVVAQAVHCSTGMTMDTPPYDTPAGSYTVFAKMLESWSVPYKVWMPYAAYFNGGIAIHGLDYVPAYPASHGCVRVSMPEAPTVYAFVSVGTPVYVF